MTGVRRLTVQRVEAELRRIEAELDTFPTVRELAATLGVSPTQAFLALDELRRDGRAERHDGWGLPRSREIASNPGRVA